MTVDESLLASRLSAGLKFFVAVVGVCRSFVLLLNHTRGEGAREEVQVQSTNMVALL